MDLASVLEVCRSAEELFSSGLFCAESVVLAIARAQGVEPEFLPKVATAFAAAWRVLAEPVALSQAP